MSTKFTIRISAALAAVAIYMAGGVEGAQTQNQCSGTVAQGLFSSTLTCTDNDCTGGCTGRCSGSDAQGTYNFCGCGTGCIEPTCCHTIMRNVWGPDIPDVAGNCTDCGLGGLSCMVAYYGWDGYAVCVFTP
jgi:hypothetical protein